MVGFLCTRLSARLTEFAYNAAFRGAYSSAVALAQFQPSTKIEKQVNKSKNKLKLACYTSASKAPKKKTIYLIVLLVCLSAAIAKRSVPRLINSTNKRARRAQRFNYVVGSQLAFELGLCHPLDI